MIRTPDLWNNRVFRRLYIAHGTNLLGSGLGSVALGLLAYELVGASAPMVLGVALTIRILVIVMLSPWAGLVAARFGSKPTLIACDFLRAGAVIGFLFATQLWHIYALAVLLNAGSAVFTPVYKAMIPRELPP
jgi:MFS family permease